MLPIVFQATSMLITTHHIGVGRFRILGGMGGARSRILGGEHGGTKFSASTWRRNDVVLTSIPRNDVASTS